MQPNKQKHKTNKRIKTYKTKERKTAEESNKKHAKVKNYNREL